MTRGQKCKSCSTKLFRSAPVQPLDLQEKRWKDHRGHVGPVDTILDAAQTWFFARVVADPSAIRDLFWPASLKRENNDNGQVEEEGRDWRDHGAYWVQNNKTDGYTSVASKIAATAVQVSKAGISWGG